MSDELQRVVEATAAALRQRYNDEFGWTRLEVTCKVDPSKRCVELHGEVLVPRIANGLLAKIGAALPLGWTASGAGLAMAQGERWHALPDSITPVYRHRPGQGRPRVLATELTRSDGPVELVVELEDAKLVRAVCGTLGWVDVELEEACEPRVLSGTMRDDLIELIAIGRSYLEVPYRLGGTTAAGIDCSGLVQRCFREAVGAILPRHSSDQLALGGPPEGALDSPGNLVFTWSSHEAPCHVGIVLDDGKVLHASRSRERVIEEATAVHLARADRVERVELGRIRSHQQRLAGRTSALMMFARASTLQSE